ncbi:conserved hypothetical protein [Dyella sp. OK004]|uniref:YybH family protein n=1 Tax=Dyella sp. OK004 TaxID=1855292 RepID=UPI0008EFF732|nr:SgcJ/EcaC family oxidoreductase [Dyella sp. OK004]SFR95145.1 conserved hypothetical protein [Dyella sp. OK004]
MRVEKLSLWVGALLLMTSFAGFAASPSTASDEAAIQQVLTTTEAAWNRGDIVGFMATYKDAPDTTFIGARVRKGFQPILESYKKNYATKEQMGTLTYSDIEVRLLPCADGHAQYATATGRFHLGRTVHGAAAKDDGVFSLVWEKTKDGWKVILDHSS